MFSSLEWRSTKMDFDFKKIEIDKDTYVKYWDRDNFELHIRASGPLGAFVYKYENGLLKWRQRRSYSFVKMRTQPICSSTILCLVGLLKSPSR